jgi:hypothetical protein
MRLLRVRARAGPGRSMASTADGRRTLSRLTAAVRSLFAPTIAAAGRLLSTLPVAPVAPAAHRAPAPALCHTPAALPLPLAEAGGNFSAGGNRACVFWAGPALDARGEEGVDPGVRFQLLDSDAGDGFAAAAAAAAAAVADGWRGTRGGFGEPPQTHALDAELHTLSASICCPCAGGGGGGGDDLGARWGQGDGEGCDELGGEREKGGGGTYDGEYGGSFGDDCMWSACVWSGRGCFVGCLEGEGEAGLRTAASQASRRPPPCRRARNAQPQAARVRRRRVAGPRPVELRVVRG